jgi:glycosyltransferase involved in cell wall biosynthesis
LELAKKHDVEVVFPVSNKHYRESVEIEGINIHYVSGWLNDHFVKANTDLQEKRHKIVSKLISLSVRAVKYVQEEFLLCPYDSTLVDAYLKKLKALNSESRIDVIISVTYPFYTHVVGLKYKEYYPSVKWLTYTTDPLAFNEANPIVPWKKKSAMKIEKQVYDACDTCIITEELFDNVVNDYGIDQKKVLVLPYLVETENVPKEKYKNENNKAQVLYAGCLFYRVRDPRIMFAVFSKLTDIDLCLYVTGDRQCRKMLKEGLPPNIHINDVVPREEYFRLLSQADVLVNLSNNAKLQAPHKLTELVSTGKPIINFYYYKNAGYKIIEKYPLGINIANCGNPDEMVATVEEFVNEYRNKRLSETEIKEIFKEYLLPYQMESIKTVIND